MMAKLNTEANFTVSKIYCAKMQQDQKTTSTYAHSDNIWGSKPGEIVTTQEIILTAIYRELYHINKKNTKTLSSMCIILQNENFGILTKILLQMV